MTGPPPPLPLNDVSLQDLAVRHGLELVGDDRPVAHLALVRSPLEPGVANTLTYVTSSTYFDDFGASEHVSAIVERRFARETTKSMLVCPNETGADTFFRVHIDLVEQGQTSNVEATRAASAQIHPAAIVMDHVQLGEDCTVDAGAVLYPNTVVEAGAYIKANATVGGEGFEVKYLGGQRTLIPHTGGVWLGPGSLVGSATCVDRGLFGTFTIVGARSHVDNLVHVAHNVQIGEDCGVVACAEISGSARLGNGVWYGPNAACNHELEFGDYCFVGTGSVVTRDVPAFTLVAGSPAKPMGHVCRCRSRIDLSSGSATCESCGTTLATGDDGAIRIVG